MNALTGEPIRRAKFLDLRAEFLLLAFQPLELRAFRSEFNQETPNHGRYSSIVLRRSDPRPAIQFVIQ
ncbi:hypothetical protein [Methylocystis sp. SC2]|uniref:hypothetical protein n=1 Tax=Methylocystis sp. (strain SC2) TaxID=187303 RepID=UPI00130ECD22|nr:hypothetical protein [Methylocystis sp. SC2]